MPEKLQFVRVEFYRFKAFEAFTLNLKHFNILVGPNNAGKSTILAAFRILAAAMRKASTWKAKPIRGPHGQTFGHYIDLSTISVAEENIFYNYDDSEPAYVTFKLSNNNELMLYFPERDTCYLIADAQGKSIQTPSTFRSHFNCSIGFVPILGPVEHNEPLYEKEAARLALFNYRAARNFRNIWHHYPEKFDEFRAALSQTWPGMDIERPVVDFPQKKACLYMFCPEERIPREIFWAGFGFQVWCQMLTHLIQSKDASLFLIDEPDIYLHSDLQRQLLNLLRNLGPDIIIATHSTEMIIEAEAEDIVLVNKSRKSAKRLKDPSQIEEVLSILGSNLNPILTQLAKTRRVVFVEGKDFQILGKFARKLNTATVGSRADFAVVSIEGFNPERMKNLKSGMETTLGTKISAAAILDRDYRSDSECASIIKDCEGFCEYVTIHKRKEIENFLLVPSALDRAVEQKLADHLKRGGTSKAYNSDALKFLDSFASTKKSYVTAQFLANAKRFERGSSSKLNEATINEKTLNELEARWATPSSRLEMIPGKEALSALNQHLQEEYGISVTTTAIIDAMKFDDIPADMRDLISKISEFSTKKAR